MIDIEIKIALIFMISAISIFFRWLAFNRVDSVALDISLVCFSFRIFETFMKYKSGSMSGKDILLCVLSFFIVLALSVFHSFNYSTLIRNIRCAIDKAKPPEDEDDDKTRELNKLKREALDNTFPLARHAIFLSYSQVLEEKLQIFVRKGKKVARENFEKLINSLDGIRHPIGPSDLLLPPAAQIKGLILFFILGTASVVLAVF